jgi:copper chaperone CopZ
MKTTSNRSISGSLFAAYDSKTATVTYDPDRTGPEALTRATANAGYPSNVHRAGGPR